ncbi:unnamed protein product [Mytilus coruscus]|uniref:ZMYM2-like/QRICH1 C-terminal domain-containing protein n=1 Tax=Mytilus coruscus TaxID=42192 RepID=A0A6J8CVA7_MYTCO|nr:unnamed protein product [Mytilus coruscus]
MQFTTDGHTVRVTKTRTCTNVRETRTLQTKMFADPGNARCPVEFHKQYIKHRPEDMLEDESHFYLGINRNIKDDIWYSRQPMGKNTLYNFVKDMCDVAGIQGRKTNDSACKTTSINSYSVASLEQQREMSIILSTVGTSMTAENNKRKSSEHDDKNMNEIVEMPDNDDAVLLSASQEAELNVVLKDITNFEKTVITDKPNLVQKSNEMPDIFHDNYKGKAVQMFTGAIITGNVTINFPA